MIHHLIPRHYSPRNTANVVVADYDPDQASALGAALLSAGWSVTLVSTGSELMDLLARPRTPLQHVDCVVTTAVLFDLGGLDVLDMFDGETDVPFVLLTETTEEREAAVRLRAAAVLQVPAPPERIRADVERALARELH